MKKLLTLGALLCCVLSLSAASLRTVEHPRFSYRNTATLEVEKVELYKDSTLFYMRAYAQPGTWVRMVSDTYIRPAGGEKQTVVSSSGLPLDTEFYLPESGEQAFILTFPALASDVYTVDFIEGEPENYFKIFGIDLLPPLRQPRTPRVPRKPMAVSNVWCDGQPQCTERFRLPLVQNQPAVFSGKITGYDSRYFDTFKLFYYNTLTTAEDNGLIEIPVRPDGTFSVSLDVLFPSQGTVSLGAFSHSVHFEPGRETVVNIDLPVISCNSSRIAELHTGDDGIAFSGELARVNEDLSRVNYRLFEDQNGFWSAVSGMSPAAYKDYVTGEYETYRKRVEETGNLTPRAREIMLNSLCGKAVSTLCQYAWNMEMGYRSANNKWDWKEPLGIEVEKPDSAYYGFLNDFPCNDERMLTGQDFCNALSSVFSYLVMRSPETKLYEGGGYSYDLYEFAKESATVRFAGSGRGIFYDLKYYDDMKNALDRMDTGLFADSVFAARKTLFANAAFTDYLAVCKERLDRKIAENRGKTGFTVNEVPAEDSLEQVIPAILERYRGKVVFVDIWETWCGPCRMAMKEAEPVKEMFKDKDVVFVYLASERSPSNTWENMIPGIPGEHYRLGWEAFAAAEKKYGITGVPTYLVVDKTGNIVHKQVGFMGAEAMKALLDVLSSPAAE